VIVVDASAALAALFNDGPARQSLIDDRIHAPHLIDSEVMSGVRRRVLARAMTTKQGWAALDVWRRLAIVRYPVVGVFDRIWELRDNLSAYDAGYVALAETLGCTLVTADTRLGSAPGVRCAVTVVPR
jgi:predicted nucleic acid-binding protein